MTRRYHIHGSNHTWPHVPEADLPYIGDEAVVHISGAEREVCELTARLRAEGRRLQWVDAIDDELDLYEVVSW